MTNTNSATLTSLCILTMDGGKHTSTAIQNRQDTANSNRDAKKVLLVPQGLAVKSGKRRVRVILVVVKMNQARTTYLLT